VFLSDSIAPNPHRLKPVLLRPKLFRVNDDKTTFATGEQVPCFVSDLPFMIQLTAIAARDKSLDDNFLAHPDWALIFDVQVGGNGDLCMKTCRLAHDFVQQQRNDPAMHEARTALVLLAEAKTADDPLARVILFERKLHAPRVRAAASEAHVIWFGIKSHFAVWTDTPTQKW
jgi:hypothetical protein